MKNMTNHKSDTFRNILSDKNPNTLVSITIENLIRNNIHFKGSAIPGDILEKVYAHILLMDPLSSSANYPNRCYKMVQDKNDYSKFIIYRNEILNESSSCGLGLFTFQKVQYYLKITPSKLKLFQEPNKSILDDTSCHTILNEILAFDTLNKLNTITPGIIKLGEAHLNYQRFPAFK